MAIQIEGVAIKKFSVERDEKTGAPAISGQYELKTPTGIVIATQNFNGYGDLKLAFSPETTKLLNDLLGAVTKEVNGALGLG